ncbi:hypothetical protein CTEN210_11879 [Chaetoceros tenuissimus]|uniref:FAD-binding FR-type domain-containing protein n=1 Tax=Chaetoceros tenuissimus TaxID=426638 RepID=A0AAD3D046_9STRA|nr:hypothetical protein CTEN210_11879 [Chaetoceros tenuissimus]
MMSKDAPKAAQSSSTTFGSTIKALNPGPIFRTVVGLYADRKFLLLVSFHVVATLICYAHFGLLKFQSQSSKVPEAAPFYTWKIGVPTFEFGTMHAILYQLAILPLTMCRLLIANFSETFVSKIIPFDEMTRCHIGIGYTFAFLLLVTIIVFLMFFGVVCNSGDQNFCKKFTTEIMITGYVIFVAFMTVAVTSFFRYKIKYRIFYVIHHVVFVAYILVILHTIDIVERKNGERSQTFKWFSASILLYATDRCTMYLAHRYDSTITSAVTIDSGEKDGRLVILKLKKPSMLTFAAGQYVYLKVPMVDNLWHPFSIASSPDNEVMSFYIKVYGEKSWSGKLFDMLQEELQDVSSSDINISMHDLSTNDITIPIEVLGPYGTALGDKRLYTHATFVGTGTGFVPCMSALEHHINACLALNPTRYAKTATKYKKMIRGLSNQDGFVDDDLSAFSESTNMDGNHFLGFGKPGKMDQAQILTAAAEIITKAAITKRKLFWHTLFMFAPALGLIAFGLTLSFSSYNFDLYDGMDVVLMSLTIGFQAIFLFSSVLTRERNLYLMVLDVFFLCLSIVADWFWISKSSFGSFRDADLVYYTLLIVYMVARLWNKTLRDVNYVPGQNALTHTSNIVYEKFNFVWSCRSAELIAVAFPDIAKLWDELVEAWGEEEALHKVNISIHCTDLNEESCQQLVDSIQDTDLFQKGCLKFGKPFLLGILEKNAMDILASDLPVSRTLFAFCGSQMIANELKAAKVLSDLVLSMTGHMSHTTDLSIQTYGSVSSLSKKRKKNAYLEIPAPHPFDVQPNKSESLSREVRASNSNSSSRFPSAFNRASLSSKNLLETMENRFPSAFNRASLSSKNLLGKREDSLRFSTHRVTRFSENFLDNEEVEC